MFIKLRAGELGYSELKPEVLKEIQDRNWIEKGITGTNFCSRRLPRHSYIPEHLGDKTQLDQCCMSLWSCEDPIQSLWYKHSLLNSSHFPLFSCPCVKQFLGCLAALEGDDEASRLRSAWAQYGGECYNLHTQTRYGVILSIIVITWVYFSAAMSLILGLEHARRATILWLPKRRKLSCKNEFSQIQIFLSKFSSYFDYTLENK